MWDGGDGITRKEHTHLWLQQQQEEQQEEEKEEERSGSSCQRICGAEMKRSAFLRLTAGSSAREPPEQSSRVFLRAAAQSGAIGSVTPRPSARLTDERRSHQSGGFHTLLNTRQKLREQIGSREASPLSRSTGLN